MSIEIARPYLHPKQQEIYSCPKRFMVINAGRRGGKTLLCTLLVFDVVLKGGRVWWIAPTYTIGKEGWRSLKQLFSVVPNVTVREGDRSITYEGSGGMVELKSADDPTTLRGSGLDLVIFDEFAFLDRADVAWEQSVRPTLSDRKGRAVFISTPNGMNYFYKIAKFAQKHPNEWAYFEFPTKDNPFIDPSEIEAAKQTLPREIFEQEYEAKFRRAGSSVFPNFESLIRDDILETEGDGESEYRIAADWAKAQDFTVFTVFNVTKRTVCFIDRFNQIDYLIQLERFYEVIDKFKPRRVIPESNSMGIVLVEHLRRKYGNLIKPFRMDTNSKRDIIESLILGFNNERLFIPRYEVLLEELKGLQVSRTRSGLISYAAPAKAHDDTVISLALAYTGGERFIRTSKGTVVENTIF